MAYRHSPLRWLAPLALVAAVIAIVLVASSGHAGSGSSGGSPSSTGVSTSTVTTSTTGQPASTRRRYKVKPGDVLSAIAAKTGVPLAQIERLNPGIDSQTLAVGQRIKLRP